LRLRPGPQLLCGDAGLLRRALQELLGQLLLLQAPLAGRRDADGGGPLPRSPLLLAQCLRRLHHLLCQARLHVLPGGLDSKPVHGR
jgi:hypothetical protein